MARTRVLDLRYVHEVRAIPAQPISMPVKVAVGRDLAARLRCLKALMDAEKGDGVWSLTPHALPS